MRHRMGYVNGYLSKRYVLKPCAGDGAPEDEEVHVYINELASSLGAYLYGRKMYETMV
jgi:hypothetical protein